MTLDDILDVCKARVPSNAEFMAFCSTNALTVEQALDEIALTVARRYFESSMAYANGDGIMNSVFAYGIRTGVLPKLMYEIYLAFDAAEYKHDGDKSDVDSEAKYTRPMIAKVLERVEKPSRLG